MMAKILDTDKLKSFTGNEHSPSDNEKDNDEVHEDTQTNNKE